MACTPFCLIHEQLFVYELVELSRFAESLRGFVLFS